MRAAFALALVIAMHAAPAHAQEIEAEAPLERAVVYPTQPPPSEALPPPPSLSEAALPEGYGSTTASEWESAPGGPEGIVDPIFVTHPDHDLLAVGAVVLAVSYTIASVLTVLLGSALDCNLWAGRCQRELGVLGVLPIAHFAAGFSNNGGAAGAFITGAVFAPIELIGLVLLIAGASHNHPALVPRQRPQAGAAAIELATF